MTDPQKREVKALIRFYERRGKDYSDALTFTVLKFEGLLDAVLHPQRFWQRQFIKPRKLI